MLNLNESESILRNITFNLRSAASDFNFICSEIKRGVPYEKVAFKIDESLKWIENILAVIDSPPFKEYPDYHEVKKWVRYSRILIKNFRKVKTGGLGPELEKINSIVSLFYQKAEEIEKFYEKDYPKAFNV